MSFLLDRISSKISNGKNAKNIKILRCQYQAIDKSIADDKLKINNLNLVSTTNKDINIVLT